MSAVAFGDIDAVKDTLFAHKAAGVAHDADSAVLQLHLVVQQNLQICHALVVAMRQEPPGKTQRMLFIVFCTHKHKM